MIYYAVIYMKTGEIHLKPFDTKEKARECLEKLKDTKWEESIDIKKIVKKDNDSTWFQSVHGYWI